MSTSRSSGARRGAFSQSGVVGDVGGSLVVADAEPAVDADDVDANESAAARRGSDARESSGVNADSGSLKPGVMDMVGNVCGWRARCGRSGGRSMRRRRGGSEEWRNATRTATGGSGRAGKRGPGSARPGATDYLWPARAHPYPTTTSFSPACRNFRMGVRPKTAIVCLSMNTNPQHPAVHATHTHWPITHANHQQTRTSTTSTPCSFSISSSSTRRYTNPQFHCQSRDDICMIQPCPPW